MIGSQGFEKSVFINCPFDADFSPLLQATAFCVVNLGFDARIALEDPNNANGRLERIHHLVETSKYAIHDISRSRCPEQGAFVRMNMPFELGIDYGCQTYGNDAQRSKSILVLERSKYDFQKCLSDISGWDIRAHENDHLNIVEHVRSWLIRQAGAPRIGKSKILQDYATFQEWYWEREKENGASDEDILAYPTIELIDLMHEWRELGKPY